MTRTHISPFNPYIAIGIVAGLAACQGNDNQKHPRASEPQNQPEVTHEHNTVEVAMNLNQQLSFSKQDLADRLETDVDNIKIKIARQITWRSGALGCPKPGMNYTQALVPGVLILLEVDGEIYGYHAQQNQKPFHCPSGQAVIPDSIQKEDLA